jgi:hypothetical protein
MTIFYCFQEFCKSLNIDGLAKSPSAPYFEGVGKSFARSSVSRLRAYMTVLLFARLETGTFCETIVPLTFCPIFNFITPQSPVKSLGSPKIFLPVF